MKKNYIKRRRSSINRAKYSIIGGMQSNHNVYGELMEAPPGAPTTLDTTETTETKKTK